MKRDWSDEQLNAFADGELPPAERARLAARCESDAGLRQRLAEVQHTRALVRGLVHEAYASLPAPRPEPSHRGVTGAGRPWRQAFAAGVLFAAGLGTGWLTRDAVVPVGPPTQALAAGPAVQAEHERIVLHVSADPGGQGLAALQHAEGLLLAARDSGRAVTIEIVANGAGLDLLRVAASPHAERIEQLRHAHPALSLVACGQTVQRLRDAGADVRLLPGATVATSALDQIVQRMQQGWAYVRL